MSTARRTTRARPAGPRVRRGRSASHCSRCAAAAARLRRMQGGRSSPRWSEWCWAPIFYTLAVIWIYRGLFHHHRVATGFGWDTIDTYGPNLDYLTSDFAHGRLSLWNPYDKGGYPVFCDPELARYYPLAWPF